jgi:hypothetical protein
LKIEGCQSVIKKPKLQFAICNLQFEIRIAQSVAFIGFIWVLLLLGPFQSVAHAQPDTAAATAPLATTAAEPAGLPLEVAVAEPQDERVDTERRRKLRLAIITGGLIGVTGLALVVFTILGGSATRRGLRRKPLRQGPPELEPIPAERFDERDVSSDDHATPAGNPDHPPQDGAAR